MVYKLCCNKAVLKMTGKKKQQKRLIQGIKTRENYGSTPGWVLSFYKVRNSVEINRQKIKWIGSLIKTGERGSTVGGSGRAKENHASRGSQKASLHGERSSTGWSWMRTVSGTQAMAQAWDIILDTKETQERVRSRRPHSHILSIRAQSSCSVERRCKPWRHGWSTFVTITRVTSWEETGM